MMRLTASQSTRGSATSSRLIAFILLALLAIPGLAVAQDGAENTSTGADKEEVAVSELFASPRATLQTFLEAMSQTPPDTGLGSACMDLSSVPSEQAADLAIYLYRCINRIEYIDLDDPIIPDATALARRETPLSSWAFFPRDESASSASIADRINSRRAGTSSVATDVRKRTVMRLAPDAKIVLRRQPNGEWKFSQQTVAGIESFWERIKQLRPVDEFIGEEYRTISERIEALWPETLRDGRFIGVKYWQWISLFVLIFVGLVVDLTTRIILMIASKRIIQRKGGEAKPETIKRMVRPFGLSLAALLWLWGIGMLGLPGNALAVLVPAVKLFFMLAMVWSAFRLTDLAAEFFESKAQRTRTKFDDVLIPLVRKALKVFIFVFGLIYIAGAFDIPLAPLLTGLGIGGAGFAFAAKDTLEHFFGSVTVIADRPFEVGDWVQIGDVEGTVEELGFRSTRVRTFYNSLVTVPNGNLVRAVVDNFGKRKYRRWSTHLNIAYHTTPEQIDAFCEGIREIIRLHPYTRKDYYQVWLHKFGPHSLDILLYVFFEAPDWNTELRERHRLSLDVIRLADRLGVEFAFPTQTLHLHQADQDAKHEPAEAPEQDAERRAEIIGRRAVRALTADADWRYEKPGPHIIKSAVHPDDDEDAPPPADDDTQIESKVGGDAGG